jgi:hypothetical protein
MNEEAAGRSRPRLMIEAFVAAGPRKSVEEYEEGAKELGEDCAGFCSVGDYVIFWICDGMSKGHELPKRSSHPGFNTRILAQDLSEGFARIMGQALMKAQAFDREVDLQKDLFGDIATAWQSRLRDYFADVESKGELERWLAELLPQMADGSYRLSWSSTFLGGVYHVQERSLALVNIGDSGAVVIGEREQKKVPPTKAREMLGATISRGERLQVEVRPLGLAADWEHFEDMECFLAMSDGVSRNLDALLQALVEAKTLPFGQLRRLLLTREELTYDDQTVIIGRLMPE